MTTNQSARPESTRLKLVNYHLPRETPFDAFTKAHLLEWCDEFVLEDERPTVHFHITRFISEHPTVLAKGYDWGTIRRLAERNFRSN